MARERILVVAHGHPDVAKGGGEAAAHHLFREYQKQGLDAVFLARNGDASHGGAAFSTRGSERELLFHTGMTDFFNFRSRDAARVWRDFRSLLVRWSPDVIHFHHYIHLGLELLREARCTCPGATIVVTLHEFLAVCAHNGQMVKTGTGQLCYRSEPADCTRCFPDRSPADFFLRERYIKALLGDVDLFIAPSEFLAARYRTWGLPSDRIVVQENGHPEVSAPPPRPLRASERRGRFAFFGQVTPYKGLDLLLRAILLLSDSEREAVHLDIHGANLATQPLEYRQSIEALAEGLTDTVTFHGPYEHQDLWALMSSVDWVLVPSIWWENSPMVIQEAFNHGRPVICSDIGGMAEKVRDGLDGLHFRARSATALRDVILRAADDSDLWDSLHSNIISPPTVVEAARTHLELYRTHARDAQS